MTHSPGRRTGTSQLTDAELTILDIAAIDGSRRRLYRDSVFQEQWNRPSHGLDDEMLFRTLHRFETERIITSEACYDALGRPDRTVRLTEVGGSLWESERLPDWMRYVDDIHPGNRISIYGYGAEACEQFFQVACNSAYINYAGGRIRRAVAERKLIYWRPAQLVYLLCAAVANQQGRRTDWSYFELHRSWWRFPNEIAAFW